MTTVTTRNGLNPRIFNSQNLDSSVITNLSVTKVEKSSDNITGNFAKFNNLLVGDTISTVTGTNVLYSIDPSTIVARQIPFFAASGSTIITSTGAGFLVISGSTGASILTSVRFNAAVGTQTFTIPTSISRIMMEAWGPGGGGAAGSTGAGAAFGGGGGGGGGYVRAIANATGTIRILVGFGGTGGITGSNGLAGGRETSITGAFGTIVCPPGGGGTITGLGGQGGLPSTSGTFVFTFASRGGGGEKPMRIQGLPVTFILDILGGIGGIATAGGGPHTELSAASVPGGGGSGGSVTGVAYDSATSGANGGDGLVIISYIS